MVGRKRPTFGSLRCPEKIVADTAPTNAQPTNHNPHHTPTQYPQAQQRSLFPLNHGEKENIRPPSAPTRAPRWRQGTSAHREGEGRAQAQEGVQEAGR